MLYIHFLHMSEFEFCLSSFWESLVVVCSFQRYSIEFCGYSPKKIFQFFFFFVCATDHLEDREKWFESFKLVIAIWVILLSIMICWRFFDFANVHTTNDYYGTAEKKKLCCVYTMNVISFDTRCVFDFLFSNAGRNPSLILSIWPDFKFIEHYTLSPFPLCVTARFTGYCSLFHNHYNFRFDSFKCIDVYIYKIPCWCLIMSGS